MALPSSRAHLAELLATLVDRKIPNPLVLITKCPIPDDALDAVTTARQAGLRTIVYLSYSGLGHDTERGIQHEELRTNFPLPLADAEVSGLVDIALATQSRSRRRHRHRPPVQRGRPDHVRPGTQLPQTRSALPAPVRRRASFLRRRTHARVLVTGEDRSVLRPRSRSATTRPRRRSAGSSPKTRWIQLVVAMLVDSSGKSSRCRHSAGVSQPSVSRGRSLSCAATAARYSAE